MNVHPFLFILGGIYNLNTTDKEKLSFGPVTSFLLPRYGKCGGLLKKFLISSIWEGFRKESAKLFTRTLPILPTPIE